MRQRGPVFYVVLFLLALGATAAFATVELMRPLTILFLGTDVFYTRKVVHGVKTAWPTSFKGNSDSMMLIRLEPAKSRAVVLQIPRDTMFRVGGEKVVQKINAANRYGGIELAKKTVTDLTGTTPDYAVVMNVKGVVDLVDSMGGIDVPVPKRMQYADKTAKLNIDLLPGMQRLNGAQAMGFVRFRHDPKGDHGRMARQKLFLTCVMDKAREPNFIARIPDFVSRARRYIKTDMPLAEMVSCAYFLGNAPKQNIEFVKIPGQKSKTGNWLVNTHEVRRFVAERVIAGGGGRNTLVSTTRGMSVEPVELLQ